MTKVKFLNGNKRNKALDIALNKMLAGPDRYTSISIMHNNNRFHLYIDYISICAFKVDENIPKKLQYLTNGHHHCNFLRAFVPTQELRPLIQFLQGDIEPLMEQLTA